MPLIRQEDFERRLLIRRRARQARAKDDRPRPRERAPAWLAPPHMLGNDGRRLSPPGSEQLPARPGTDGTKKSPAARVAEVDARAHTLRFGKSLFTRRLSASRRRA